MAWDPWVEAGTDVDVSLDFVSHETVTPVYPPVVLNAHFRAPRMIHIKIEKMYVQMLFETEFSTKSRCLKG